MKISVKMIKDLGPCSDGFKWYLENQKEDLLELLIDVNSNKSAVDENGTFQGSAWARWLFTRLMSKNQCVQIAIFSAKEVLYIYEDKYKGDLRPRKAIEAAEVYLKDPSEENRQNADAADAAAAAAVAAAYAAADAAAAAAYAAADAAAAYAYAADAAYAAAAAADAAADKKQLQEKIIREAVKILDGE